MAVRTVPGFLPSRHGFHFANRWPPGPALEWHLGLVHLGLGDTGRGLCGGMAFGARDRFDRAEPAPVDTSVPPPGSALFREIVRRQVDSFDHWVVVPWRFWAMTLRSQAARDRHSATVAWPAIRAQIDAGEPAMVGLVRTTSPNPLRLVIGHQVAAFGYEVTRDLITLRIYDPNHPDDDSVELSLRRRADGSVAFAQSTGEPLHGGLARPYRPPGR